MNRFRPSEGSEPRTATHLLHLGAEFSASWRELSLEAQAGCLDSYNTICLFVYELCKYARALNVSGTVTRYWSFVIGHP